MISKLDLQRFSTPELAIGGVALATVALVTLIDLRASRPGIPSAQPQRVALLAPPQNPQDPSRFESTGSIDPSLSEQSEPRETTREPQLAVEETLDPPSANSNTASANWNAPRLSKQTTDSRDPGLYPKQTTDSPDPGLYPKQTTDSVEPGLNPQNPSDAIWVQARLADLGYFTSSRSGVWGPASRSALRDFKSMNGLQEDDRWDRDTEQRLSSKQVVPAAKTFIGGWAEDIDQCRNGSPLVINSRNAKAAGAECDFRSVRRETAGRWHVRALCNDGGSSWNANISLKLAMPKLIWSSERGTATYVRCPKSIGENGTLIQSLGDWLDGVRKTVLAHE